jgi:hypothetical protein
VEREIRLGDPRAAVTPRVERELCLHAREEGRTRELCLRWREREWERMRMRWREGEREGVERMRADGRCRSAGMEAPNPNFSYI